MDNLTAPKRAWVVDDNITKTKTVVAELQPTITQIDIPKPDFGELESLINNCENYYKYSSDKKLGDVLINLHVAKLAALNFLKNG